MIGGYYARTLIGEIGYLMVVQKKNFYGVKIAQGFMKPPSDRLRLCVLAGTKIQRLFRGTGSLSIYMEDPLTTIWEEKHVRNETIAVLSEIKPLYVQSGTFRSQWYESA